MLAKSGFGKTNSYCGRKLHGIVGLDPKETFLIQCINREIPNQNYKTITGYKSDGSDMSKHITKGNRLQVGSIEGLDRFKVIAAAIPLLANSPFTSVIIDDFNYLAQDYYMANAMKGGWDTPKQIGYGMGLIFSAFEALNMREKDLFVFAHYEEYKDKNKTEDFSYKFKTTGKMVDDYITPEGKFDVVLYGKEIYLEKEKTITKQWVIHPDGEYPVKDSLGIMDEFPSLILNDMHLIKEGINKFYSRK